MWAYLFDGVASAIIGGAVAALTAWTVVVATRRHDRHLANERAARDATLKLMRSLVLLSAEIREYKHARNRVWLRRRCQDALVAGHVRLANDLYAAVPLITTINADLATEIGRIGGTIGMLLPDHSLKCSNESLEQALKTTNDLQMLVGVWLADGDWSAAKRAIGQNSAAPEDSVT
jgi:hypothetical protein